MRGGCVEEVAIVSVLSAQSCSTMVTLVYTVLGASEASLIIKVGLHTCFASQSRRWAPVRVMTPEVRPTEKGVACVSDAEKL